ncbi:MAG: RsmB/NOP family class I SAM-dependent RNA methyltransferase [Candidatus Hodarchaeota archaeon]
MEEADVLMESVPTFPIQFQKRFQALLGEEYDQFITCLSQPLTSFVRINTLKVNLQRGFDQLKALDIAPISLPWFAAGFRVTGNLEQLPFTREYALGYYYIQEGGSMIPPITLDPQSSHTILDLCAAPGSKTTQLAQIMRNQGVIIANDRSFRRLTSLGHNIQLCGVINTFLLCTDGRHLATQFPLKYDRVLVDAPCTASGHLRSKPPQLLSPNLKRIRGIQAVQKGLLTSGFKLLKPNGLLVYATCSLHPEENEVIVNHLLSKFNDAKIERPVLIGLKSHSGLTHWEDLEFNDVMHKCLRVYPHDNDTDGFFIALIRRITS